MSATSLLGIYSTNHLGSVLNSLLRVERTLQHQATKKTMLTFFPVIPWPITLVFLSIHTRAVLLARATDNPIRDTLETDESIELIDFVGF